MKLKVFTFRFSESVDGFDDKPMQEFIADKEVIEFTEHFFIHEKTPYLTVIVSYRETSPDERKKGFRQDPVLELDDREKEVYNALRTWRAARAKQDGIPPYMIVNNKQLAKMVTSRVKTKSDLARIKGIGEAKVKQYGEEILKILAERLVSDPADTSETEKETVR